jgi:hypothetical protein
MEQPMHNLCAHACRLAPKTERPSQWFADLIGASVAAIAMAVACATIVFAQLATKGSHRLFEPCWCRLCWQHVQSNWFMKFDVDAGTRYTLVFW